jgi:hypothetical protein
MVFAIHGGRLLQGYGAGMEGADAVVEVKVEPLSRPDLARLSWYRPPQCVSHKSATLGMDLGDPPNFHMRRRIILHARRGRSTEFITLPFNRATAMAAQHFCLFRPTLLANRCYLNLPV